MATHLMSPSVLAFLAISFPALASSATLVDTLAFFNTFLNATIGLLITLAIVAFFWGLIQYIFGVHGSTDAASKGVQIMFWGVIAIFVMVSVWGIIRLLQTTFKVTSTDPIVPKGIQINTRGF
ncbi:hypothetical protein A2673_03220 [Candidatus Kaiserbacteria bacterium RIFCSPHIGHO2_01_FULL_50_13]|uniref:Uncharacterized protein n=1 Tax=Candidatus Kaiserbacteria bacterium RIFCSPLOWO2_01_FULL_50_24 TaxID=1798507 RepID=A0A1F6EIN6_9BACT|nr:MAG: hypothetical protein A2673_03220 [Candidatus Kaiserbacteria bacterium RIFCSPHIGHO2_01_FULL_50_13]OGG73515.1 MAG: hypothetical protein A3A34_01060 [Candidatus Kaiserbacteria bacterium RIFCSPLOWO2_01_FULL_50_24]OGG81564.1 MAG: hypothetical protein A3H74_00595 [Candidatus Kaiserbacteria bacterium RIFCSPLOWO2_02_FULL_51_13]